METKPYRIMVSTDESQFIDMAGIANELLTKLCNKSGLHPMAVLTAALVLLWMREE
jgi:hypothetical protein